MRLCVCAFLCVYDTITLNTLCIMEIRYKLKVNIGAFFSIKVFVLTSSSFMVKVENDVVFLACFSLMLC